MTVECGKSEKSKFSFKKFTKMENGDKENIENEESVKFNIAGSSVLGFVTNQHANNQQYYY